MPVFLGALALYVATLLPDVGIWDTAEFQALGPVLGTASLVVPTGKGLHVLDSSSGDLAWQHTLTAAVARQPIVGDDGAVYFTSIGEDHKAHAVGVDASGGETFACLVCEDTSEVTDLGSYGHYYAGLVEPLLTADGDLIVAVGGKVVALPVTSRGLAASGWPKARADNHNSGRVH